MIVYSNTYEEKNSNLRKEVKWVVELSLDIDNTDLYYFTSHEDCEVPPNTPVSKVFYSSMVKPIITSQKLDTRNTNFTIGSLTFDLIDKNGEITNFISLALENGFGLRRKRVRIRRGYKGLLWADYQIPPGGTQIIEGKISSNKGKYTFRCNDIQRIIKKDIFEQKSTNLMQNYVIGDSIINCVDTSEFEMVVHGASFDNSPNETVGYIQLKSGDNVNVIKYTGKTENTFTGCVGGQFNTKDFNVNIDVNVTNERQPEITEFIYLQLPAAKMAKAILLGTNPVLPKHWTLEVDPSYVNINQFDNIGKDLYDVNDDRKGFMLSFTGLSKRDGKKFYQEQINLPAGCFSPILADGKFGYKRMTGILSGASPVAVLDSSNTIKYSSLDHDLSKVANIYVLHWNKTISKNKTTRTNIYIDSTSIDINQKNKAIELKFEGIHGNFATDSILESTFDALRDRFAGTPILLKVECFDLLNGIEVGDIVWCRFDEKDFTNNGGLNRAFEVIGYKSSGSNITLDLFGSSQRPDPITTPSNVETVLPDSFYSNGLLPQNKIDLVTNGTYIGDVWHITSDSTITGDSSMELSSSIFWFAGSVVLQAGVTLNLMQNVQLRIMNMQNNGIINLLGNGLPGAAAGTEALGIPGWIGLTKAGSGFFYTAGYDGKKIPSNSRNLREIKAETTISRTQQSGIPNLILKNELSFLDGLNEDMRTTSGGAGINVSLGEKSETDYPGDGGKGGNGGAACVFITRIFGNNENSKIILDGENGQSGNISLVNSYNFFTRKAYAGAGATGSPGIFYLLIDGNSSVIPSISQISAKMNAPIILGYPHIPDFNLSIGNKTGFVKVNSKQQTWPIYNSEIGFFGFDFTTSYFRIQRIPKSETPIIDIDENVLQPPVISFIDSGTNELLKQKDGTIIVRALFKWNVSTDSRTIGYKIRFKRSTDTLYNYLDVEERNTNQVFIPNLSDGEYWDFGVKAKSISDTSVWVDINDQLIIGKTENPLDVSTFLVQRQPDGTREFSWTANEEVDHAGYKIKYILGSSGSWETMIPLHTGLLNASPFETNQLAAGTWTFAIKQVDTTGNESQNALFINGITLLNPRIAGSIGIYDPHTLKWPGLKTNCWVDNNGNLYATDTKTWDDLLIDGINWGGWTPFWPRLPNQTIIYQHSTIDIGVISLFIPLITATGDGTILIEEQHSDDDISYTNWAIAGQQLNTRFLRIRVTVTNNTSLASLTQMLIILSAELIQEDIEDLDTSTLTGANRIAIGHVKIPFVKNYAKIKHASIVLQNVGAGWTSELISKADLVNGPEFKIYNNGVLADALIDAQIRGL